jgi:hypothetical protein
MIDNITVYNNLIHLRTQFKREIVGHLSFMTDCNVYANQVARSSFCLANIMLLRLEAGLSLAEGIILAQFPKPVFSKGIPQS